MKRNRFKCEMCDKLVSEASARGWCPTCEAEFEHIHATRLNSCGDCQTNISCVIKRCCLKEEARELGNGMA